MQYFLLQTVANADNLVMNNEGAQTMDSKPVIAIEQDADGWTRGFRVIGDATSHTDARTLAASYGRVIANNNGIARRDLTPIVRAAGYARADSVHAILVERVQ